MSAATDSSLETRQSLLSRLRNLDDRESWRIFFELYWRLLYNVARRAGLDEPDAQDVVQDTVTSVAREMPQFHYDPDRGSFKSWLFRIVQRRIADHFRRIYRQPHPSYLNPDDLEERADPAIAAMGGVEDIDRAWDQEWERAILDAAVAQVRTQVDPKNFQAFNYCVLKEWPISKVAATLGMNAAQVYMARHRVSQVVKREARRINAARLRGRLA